MIVSALLSTLRYGKDLKEVACLPQYQEGLLEKSRMESLYSALVASPPIHSPPIIKEENMVQGKLDVQFHVHVDQLLDIS